MRRLDLVALGLDAIRGLRIGAHVGPVFEGFDAVGQERNFFGADVTKAARIEPRTPEGEVFVTAPFAALVQLEGDRRWSCQYVGNVPTAKDYGVLPMYVLKRRT
jgi:class 3 adenylate cyclase